MSNSKINIPFLQVSGTNLGGGIGLFESVVFNNLNFKSISSTGSSISLFESGNTLIISGASISGVPGGSNTEIQFNNSGSFDGNSGFTINDITNSITIGTRLGGNASKTLVVGENNEASSSYSFVAGCGNIASNGNANIALGYNNCANSIGGASFAAGFSNVAIGNQSVSLGDNNRSEGAASFTVGTSNIAQAACSAIIGGNNNTIEASNDRSVIVGGQGNDFTGSTYIDYVGVPNLVIFEVPSGGTTGDTVLVRDSNDNKIKGLPVSAFTGSGSLPGGANTNIQFNDNSTFQGNTEFAFNCTSCSLTLGIRAESAGNRSVIFGQNNEASGVNSFAGGLNSIAQSTLGFAFGSCAVASGSTGGVAFGNQSCAVGGYSLALGSFTKALGANSIALGTLGCSIGTSSFTVGSSNRACSVASAVVGGNNNEVGNSNLRTVLLGGQNIILTGSSYTDHVVVPSLAIFNTLSIGTTGDTVLVRDSSTGIIRGVFQSGFTGGGTGATNATNGLTLVGDTVILGGILTGITSINTNNFGLGIGVNTCTIGNNSFAVGNSACATGLTSFAQGLLTIAGGNNSFAGGKGTTLGATKNTEIRALGYNSFNFSANNSGQENFHGALADYSAILGGQNHNIESGSTRAIILGGFGIKLTGNTYENHVAVPQFAIMSGLTTGSVDDGVLVRNSSTGIIRQVSQSGFTGGSFNNFTISADTGSVLVDNEEIITFVGGTNVTTSIAGNIVTIDATGGGTGSTNPGGVNTNVQFNNAGSFGGNAEFAFDNSTCGLTLGTRSGTVGTRSLAIGQNICADGSRSFAGGVNSIASNTIGFAFGVGTIASGSTASFAIGGNNCASGQYSFVGGNSSVSSAFDSFAFGNNTLACADQAVAFGNGTIASGCDSIAFGGNSCATGLRSFAGGIFSCATELNSFAFGQCITSSGTSSFGIGFYTNATGNEAFSSGIGLLTGNRGLISCASASFNHSENTILQISGHGALADNSAILGGLNHNIESGNTRAAIIGGDGIKLTGTTYIDTTAVDNLAVISTPSTGLVSDNVLVRRSTTGVIYEVTQASISDVRLKKNLEPINNSIIALENIDAYKFEFNELTPNSGITSYGLIAQEVEKEFPYVVKNNINIDNTIYKTVEYREIVPILWDIVKKLNIKINKLEEKNK